jgi:hypothetical protein
MVAFFEECNSNELASDTLYFDRDFGSVAKFANSVVAVHKERVHRVAFHLQQQGEQEYYGTGADLSLCFYYDFPNLTHLLLPAIDYGFDYELEMKGLPQPERYPKKTVISFCDADPDDVK